MQHIKSSTKDWIPYEVDENPLRHLTLEEIRGMLGAKLSFNDYLHGVYKKPTPVKELPEHFDSREQWP